VRRRGGVRRVRALRQVLEGGGELGGEVAGGRERIPLAAIEPVVAAPGAEHHRRVLEEVPVDGDRHPVEGERGGLQPGGVRGARRLAGGALAQAQDVRDHAGAFLGEGLGGQADGAQEIRLLRERLPQAWMLLVQGVVRGDQGQHAARLQDIKGFRQEEVMQGEARPVIVQPKVGERHIADDGVDTALRQAGVAEVFDADVVAGVQRPCDAPGEVVQLHADEAHARRGVDQKVPNAAAGLEHGGIGGHPQARQGCVHRLHDHRRRIERRKGVRLALA